MVVAITVLAAACTASTTVEPTAAVAVDLGTAVPDALTDAERAADEPDATAPPSFEPTAAPVQPTVAPSPEPTTQEETPPVGAAPGSVEVTLIDAGAEPRTELRMVIAPGCSEITIVEQTQGITQSLAGTALPGSPPVGTVIETATSVQINGDDYDVRSEVVSASAVPGTDPAVAALLNVELEGLVGLISSVTLTNRGVQIPDSVRIEGAEGNATLQSVLESVAQIQAPLPVEPVGVGARWQTVSVVDFEGAELTNTTNYLITAIDGTVVTVDLTATQTVPIGETLTLEGFEVEVAAWTGTSTGQTTIDLATISPISSTLTGQAEQALDFGPAAGGVLEQEVLTQVELRGEPNEGCTGRSTLP